MAARSNAAVADRTKMREAVQAIAEQVAGLIRPLGDSTAVRIPGSEWTVGEAASHLAWAQQLFSQIAGGAVVHHGDGTPQGLAQANAHALDQLPERNGERLADLIVDGTRTFLALAATAPGRVVESPVGRMDLDNCTSYMLIHLVMHGWSIADALHKRFAVDASHVEMGLPFLVQVIPWMLRPDAVEGFTACYDVRFRGGSRLAFMFDDGKLTIAPRPTRRADCNLSADPVAFLLVGMGLKSQWGQIARGRLMTWGRKPWLALRFVGFFSQP
jgi:uncharacterized protein (TIGR03083 family)